MKLHFSVLALTVASALGGELTREQVTFFEGKIRPVLVKHCFECHAVGAKKIGGNLYLDSAQQILTGGESGPALIPGKPDESLLIQALLYDGIEMPPKKRLAPPILEDFKAWIRMGAPDPRQGKATPVSKEPKQPLSWAFQPLQESPLPKAKDASWPRQDLDFFILAKLETNRLSPAPDASLAALRRRLSYDLTGLPPAPDDTTDPRSPAFVDRLLNSLHFGEKWGRFWLDIARFAESNGNDGLGRNASFPHAWRYRDYVIAAFNEDTPYDRFLREQLAGDLLPATSLKERDRHLTATGFLAIGAKPAKAMNEHFEMDVVADQIHAVGTGILGISVGCARCHDHKTDPIPTRDYYALAGIFKSTETLWGAAAFQALTAQQTPLHQLFSAQPVRKRAEIEPILKANPPSRTPAKPAFAYEDDAALALGVREAKKVANCKVNISGDSKKLGAEVTRGFLSSCGDWGEKYSPPTNASGRLQLAQWLTDPRHPLTARVFVNRVWSQLFGTGLVSTTDDFGSTGEKPTHPELLDFLALRFMREGWSVKRLIRSIVLSRAYQQSVSSSPPVLFSAQTRRRLSAESLRDTLLILSGKADFQPANGSLIQNQDVLINELPPLHQPNYQRSVYLLMLRQSMPEELTPFHLPDASSSTSQRGVSTQSAQALYWLNHPTVVKLARAFAQQGLHVQKDPDQRLVWTFHQAFGRFPTSEEVQKAKDFLLETESFLVSTHAPDSTPELASWSALCQALFMSNELSYLD